MASLYGVSYQEIIECMLWPIFRFRSSKGWLQSDPIVEFVDSNGRHVDSKLGSSNRNLWGMKGTINCNMHQRWSWSVGRLCSMMPVKNSNLLFFFSNTYIASPTSPMLPQKSHQFAPTLVKQILPMPRQALEACVKLANQFIADRCLPDKVLCLTAQCQTVDVERWFEISILILIYIEMMFWWSC